SSGAVSPRRGGLRCAASLWRGGALRRDRGTSAVHVDAGAAIARNDGRDARVSGHWCRTWCALGGAEVSSVRLSAGVLGTARYQGLFLLVSPLTAIRLDQAQGGTTKQYPQLREARS